MRNKLFTGNLEAKTKSIISIENRRFRSCHACGFQLNYGDKTVSKGSGY